MYTIVLRITQDKKLSEDILQEVFIILYQSPPKPPIKNPRAYIFQIAHNLAIDNVRKHINGKLKFREIADMMDIPLGTVLWKYQKAVGRLRSILSGGAV
jgi:RNA polymerase sigma-70 factor (ECF subfamily)